MKVLFVRAFLRKYKVEYSDKWKTSVAIPSSDTLIGEFKCPKEAYDKTQRLIKKDYDKGIVQDVWFQTDFRWPVLQLELF